MIKLGIFFMRERMRKYSKLVVGLSSNGLFMINTFLIFGNGGLC